MWSLHLIKENGRSNFIEKFPQIPEAEPETLLEDTVVCMTTTQWWQIHFQNSFVSGSIFFVGGGGEGWVVTSRNYTPGSITECIYEYFWFATTWQGQNNIFLSKNLHENGVKFPEERNVLFFLDHQHGLLLLLPSLLPLLPTWPPRKKITIFLFI